MQPAMRDRNFVSPWYKRVDIEGLLFYLCLGDRLEFDRTAYKHWAVCVTIGPDAHVVHRTGDSSQYVAASISSSSSYCGGMVGKICLEALLEVLGTDRVRINNSLDAQKRPKPERAIMTNAVSAIDNDDHHGDYHVVFNNCEHFVNWCRYESSQSQQVTDTLLAVGVALLSVAVSATLRVLRS